MTLRNDGLQPGDIKFKPGNEVPLETDGTGVKGDAVTFNVDGKVTPTTATADALIGQLGEEPRWDGHVVSVRIAGLVVIAEVSGAVSPGDVLEPDSANPGKYVANANGMYQSVDEGGTATYDLALNHPIALETAAAGETVMALYR